MGRSLPLSAAVDRARSTARHERRNGKRQERPALPVPDTYRQISTNDQAREEANSCGLSGFAAVRRHASLLPPGRDGTLANSLLVV
jgi:hypothetical protein